MTRLDIPYRSQWDADAEDNKSDCGPTCVAMILNYHDIDITPDGVYAHLPPKEPTEFTNFVELIDVFRAHHLPVHYRRYDGQEEALASLRANIDAGHAIIALVKYASWREETGNQFDWGHFAVVTGYDDAHIYVHDPLFGLWKPRSSGTNYALTQDLYCAGWGGFPVEENPNWACCIVADQVADPLLDTIPTPVVPTTPLPTPPAPPTTPIPSSRTMDDVYRRIRALAAYRWAETPDFDNPETVKLWLDHLGDWGLMNEEYVVQAGDTLIGVAARFYGQQHRWSAIKVYNELTRDGLWVGETLLIPQLGQSGAHEDPALPSDTTDFAKAIDLENLADPELPALDYNSLGSQTIGIGFVEPGVH